MAPTFPLPRSLLPTVDVTPQETSAAKRMMDALLRHTVREYVKLNVDTHGVVDTQRWKHMATQDKLLVFREREAGAMSASLAQELEGNGGESLLMPNRDAVAALATPTLLMAGSCTGRVENTMYAVVTETHDDLALVVKFLHEDVADCAILSTMEGPTHDQPHRFLGYKYFVRKSPTEGRMLKHRDSLYLEYCGYTRCPRTGDLLGFHLMHSVDLPEFPSLRGRNSVRALQSVRYLYRQRSDDTVDVFMLGNLDVAGSIVKPIANMFTMTTLFGIARLPACAEARRLTQMTKQRIMHDHPHVGRVPVVYDSCAVCQGRRGSSAGSNVMKLLGARLPVKCHVCGQLVCSRCRRTKRVFERDPEGVLGKFHKVHACSTCVLVANAGFATPYLSTSEGSSASSSTSTSSWRMDRRTRKYSSYKSPSSSNSYMSVGFYDDAPRLSHSTVNSLCMSDDMDPTVEVAAGAMRRLQMAAPSAGNGRGRSRREAFAEKQSQSYASGNSSRDSDATWSSSDGMSSSLSVSNASVLSRSSYVSGESGDLYMRLLELQKAAESAYNTAQQNSAMAARQRRQTSH